MMETERAHDQSLITAPSMAARLMRHMSSVLRLLDGAPPCCCAMLSSIDGYTWLCLTRDTGKLSMCLRPTTCVQNSWCSGWRVLLVSSLSVCSNITRATYSAHGRDVSTNDTTAHTTVKNVKHQIHLVFTTQHHEQRGLQQTGWIQKRWHRYMHVLMHALPRQHASDHRPPANRCDRAPAAGQPEPRQHA